MYKPSRFNVLVNDPDNQDLLVFNTLNGKLRRVSHSVSVLLTADRVDQQAADFELELTLVQLVQDGFLIDSDLDELATLRFQNAIGRFRQDQMVLTVMPTLGCNLNCRYCFENHVPKVMSDETAEQLLKYYQDHLPGKKQVEITWFGGEPLLELSRTANLNRAFRELAMDQGTAFRGSIVTNGYLLREDAIRLLEESGISEIQITLDGLPEAHNLRKGIRDTPRHERYFRLLKQIHTLVDRGFTTVVRVNLDQENSGELEAFFRLMSDYQLHQVFFYPAQVYSYDDTSAPPPAGYLDTKAFTDVKLQFLHLLIDHGFRVDFNRILRLSRTHYCAASQLESQVVAPDGYLYKCWTQTDDPRLSTGQLSSPTITRRQRQTKAEWLNWSPFDFSACRACQILPLCMGGCLYRGRVMNNGQPECDDILYGLEQLVLLCARYEKI